MLLAYPDDALPMRLSRQSSWGCRSRFLRARSWHIAVRGSAWWAAICMSRGLMPASAIVVTNVLRSMWGCTSASGSRRVGQMLEPEGGASCRSVRAPWVLRRTGPLVRSSTARVDSSGDRRWRRDEHDFAALAAIAGPGGSAPRQGRRCSTAGLEDSQAEQAEQAGKGDLCVLAGMSGKICGWSRYGWQRSSLASIPCAW